MNKSQQTTRKSKCVRPMALHIGDNVTRAFRRSKIPKGQLPPAMGVVALTKQIARGDYQCNIPMQVHARYIRPLKTRLQAPVAAPVVDAAAVVPVTNEGKGKKEKKARPQAPISQVYTIPSQPHIFDPQNDSTLPETAHDLAYQMASQLIDTKGEEVKNPKAGAKNSSDFFPIQDSMFQSLSIAQQGFLGLRLNNKYIAKRLVPFLVQNDVPPPLFYESDMKSLTSSQVETSHHDDRALSIAPSAGGAPIPLPSYPRVVTIDYSSPNIAKEMHVGHIRSTCIGDSVAKILEFGGYTVQRINHLGDWGTQFGMLLCHYNDMLVKGERDLSKLDVSDLATFYREAKQRFDKEPEFAKDAKEYVVKLQGGDKKCLGVWKEFCSLSRPTFQNIFTRLQIDPRLLERGESFYQPFLADAVDELLTAGIAVERDGAVLLPPASYFNKTVEESNDGNNNDNTTTTKQKAKPDTKKVESDNEGEGGDDDQDAIGSVENELIPNAIVLRKTDGGFTYGATDLAAIRLRLLGKDCWFNQKKHQPEWFDSDIRYQDGLDSILPTDWALYVVDSGQSVHFSGVFSAAERAGWVQRAQDIAQDRKMRYFNDIIESITEPNTNQSSSDQATMKNNRAIARVALDGDTTDFTADLQNQQSIDNTLDKPDLRVEHVQFGVVCGADGKRLRTRAGQQIKLVDLLDESVTRSKALIADIANNASSQLDPSNSDLTAGDNRKARRIQLLTKPEIAQQLAENVGYASIKYSDLSKNRISDYNFDFDTMLDMTGNTAGYLLYAHARLFSILQRVGGKGEANDRYHNHIQNILNKSDPLGHFDRLVDYDFQHLNQHTNKPASPYESLLDVLLHHPDMMKDFIGADADSNAEQALLVSSVLAQYQSDYALDTSQVVYPLRKHHNDDLWTNTTSSDFPSLIQKINPEFVKSITHNVSTLDPTYGISFASQHQPELGDVYHKFPSIALDHQSERQLGLHVAQFHDSLAQSISGITPHVMAGYTFDLSSYFSDFYRDCTVNIKSGETPGVKQVGTKNEFNTQDSRVLLTHATAVTLQRGLDLIGVQPTKFM